jgi:hypothetical protein
MEAVDCRTISERSERSDSCDSVDQEYIIKRSDLRGFIQKMAMENYELAAALEEKQRECEKGRN